MRVHGKEKIKRRLDISLKPKYRDYLPEIKEDFNNICGYCGKSIKVTKNTFEIDHFVPISFAPELKNEYSNLVYSCYTCNRKKSKTWPTNNKLVFHNDKEGFVDPATDEYDLHLERLADGTIQPITEVGEYMCNEVFKFKLRPIKEIWICEQIVVKQEELQRKIENMTPEEYCQYIKLDMQLKALMNLLFSKKE